MLSLADRYIAFGVAKTSIDKFILIKILAMAGEHYYVQGADRKLAKNVGVADKTFSKSLAYWLSTGALERESKPQERGRPIPRYWIRPQHIKMMPSIKAASLTYPFSAFVENLAGLDQGKKFGGGKHDLDYGTRILLMVLFAHADHCGVVRDLGYSDLTKLSGLSKQGVLNHLGSLLKNRYIRSSVSGLTGKTLFGKTKSVYFLNLNHRHFGELRRPGLITVYQAFESGSDLQEAPRLLEAAKAIKKGHNPPEPFGAFSRFPLKLETGTEWINQMEKFLDILTDGKESDNLPLLEMYLQHKLEEYASRMLSMKWGSMIRMIDYQPIRNRIRRDLIPLKDLIEQKDKVEGVVPRVSEKQIASFVEAIAIIAAHIADSVIQLVPKEGINYSQMDHVLLPLPNNRHKRASFTLVSFPKAHVKQSFIGCNVVKLSSDGLRKVSKYKSEDMFDELDLLEYGLNSLPNSKLRTWNNSKFSKQVEAEKNNPK